MDKTYSVTYTPILSCDYWGGDTALSARKYHQIGAIDNEDLDGSGFSIIQSMMGYYIAIGVY